MAARPLLLHAPADSSIVTLADREPGYASWWKNLDAAEARRVLEQLWNDPARHASAHEAAERVRACYYDDERNRQTLFASLNALVPPLENREINHRGTEDTENTERKIKSDDFLIFALFPLNKLFFLSVFSVSSLVKLFCG